MALQEFSCQSETMSKPPHSSAPAQTIIIDVVISSHYGEASCPAADGCHKSFVASPASSQSTAGDDIRRQCNCSADEFAISQMIMGLRVGLVWRHARQRVGRDSTFIRSRHLPVTTPRSTNCTGCSTPSRESTGQFSTVYAISQPPVGLARS